MVSAGGITSKIHRRNALKFATKLALAAAVAAISSAALADNFYVGADAGRSSLDADSSNGVSYGSLHGTSFGVYGGYQISPTIALELAYHDLGKSSTTAYAFNQAVNVNVKANATSLSAVALLPFNTDFAGFARLGFSSIHATATASQFGYTGSASQTDTKALVGVGLKYNLTKDFAFRTEYTRYASNFSTVSIGGEVKF
jgi:hypothetical protein